MEHTGQVYKFIGLKGLIRPDTWKYTRRDILFTKAEFDLKIGDKVTYDCYEENGRMYALNLSKQ
jgi:hypothetical protein